MAQRFRSPRKVFNAIIYKDLPGAGVCLIDHGVAGGLIQLLASTYYYRLQAAARSPGSSGSALAQRIRSNDWSPTFWWTAIVWGTAAAGYSANSRGKKARRSMARKAALER